MLTKCIISPLLLILFVQAVETVFQRSNVSYVREVAAAAKTSCDQARAARTNGSSACGQLCSSPLARLAELRSVHGAAAWRSNCEQPLPPPSSPSSLSPPAPSPLLPPPPPPSPPLPVISQSWPVRDYLNWCSGAAGLAWLGLTWLSPPASLPLQ